MKKILVLICLLLVCLALPCIACSDNTSDTVEKECIHVFGKLQKEVPATCVTNGVKAHKDCEECGKHFDRGGIEIYDLSIKAPGHSYGEWVTVRKPTVNEDGEAQRECSVCMFIEKKIIGKISEEKTYKIIYDLDGGEFFKGGNPSEYKNTDDDIRIENPYKKGYVFGGWSQGDSAPEKNFVIIGGSQGDIRLVAVYKTDSSNYYNGNEVDVCPGEIKDYLKAENKAEYLYRYQTNYETASNPSGITFEWKNVYGADEFIVSVKDENGAEIFSENTNQTLAVFYNPIPNVLYDYTIIDSAENLLKKDSFKVSDPIRTIYCGNISNVRDEGGKTTSEGTTKYGLIYRSPEIVGANAEAKDILVNKLGIKTEIDLRIGSTTKTIDESITKYTFGIWQWDYLFPGMNADRPWNAQYTDSLKSIFKLFADKRNYPIVFHCSQGADRTGAIAFLLNGLLGASYDDLVADFEITSFYFGKRWRSDITVTNGIYKFSDNGIMQDDPDNLVAFDKTYNYLMKTYATESGELKDAIANYLKTVAGLTDYDINAIKHIMYDTSEHEYGEWEIVDRGSCQKEGEKRRYCACGIYESEVMPITGHAFGDWTVVTEPTVENDGLEKRYCECGTEENRVVPHYIGREYDFGGEGLDASVNNEDLKRFSAALSGDASGFPDGYSDEVYTKTDEYLVCVGIGFDDDYDLDKLVSLKIRLCIQGNSAMPKGNVRIYDDSVNSIRAEGQYGSLSGVYNEWVEIDLLSLIKTAKDSVCKDGSIQKFVLVIRTGALFTVSFDSITVVTKA